MKKIAQVVKDYPNFKINLDTSYECEDLIVALKQNKIDFAILDRIPTEYDHEKDLEIKELKKSEYIFIADKEILIENVNEFNNYKYILAGEQRGNTIKLSDILKEYNIELEAVLRCRNNRAKNKCYERRNWNSVCFKRGYEKSIRQ